MGFASQVNGCEPAADLWGLLSPAVRCCPQAPPVPGLSAAQTGVSAHRGVSSIPASDSNSCSIPWFGGDLDDPALGRPIAAPLAQCAELLGVDLATVRELAEGIEAYRRSDGTEVWSLMQLERQLRPQAYGTRRGGYRDRRRNPAAQA